MEKLKKIIKEYIEECRSIFINKKEYTINFSEPIEVALITSGSKDSMVVSGTLTALIYDGISTHRRNSLKFDSKCINEKELEEIANYDQKKFFETFRFKD